MVRSERAAASACTAGETPWALKTTTDPSGTSSVSSTKTAPRRSRVATTCLLWTICLRTYTGAPCSSSAFSTATTARSTPAQYPRGSASRTRPGDSAMPAMVGGRARLLPGVRRAPPSGASALTACVVPAVLGQAVVMSREIPELVRAAAGLAATVLDEARKLPETLPGLPVRVIGFALQKAMWLQQQYSGLVARGDELFTGTRGDDEPGLATFDEDLPADSAPAAATPPGFRDSAFDRVEAPAEEDILSGLPEDDVALVDESAAQEADAEVRAAFSDNLASEELAEELAEEVTEELAEAALDELALEQLVDDETAGLPADPAPEEVVAAVEDITVQVEGAGLAPAPEGTATEDADAVENALLEADAAAAGAAPGSVPQAADVGTPEGGVAPVGAAVTDGGVAAPEADPGVDGGGTPVAAATGASPEVDPDAGPADEGGTTGPADDGGTADSSAPATAPIEGYDAWSIAQLRGRLRGYQAVTVAELVAYEEATRAREPYLRMLRNRLEKLDEQAVEASPLAPRGA